MSFKLFKYEPIVSIKLKIFFSVVIIFKGSKPIKVFSITVEDFDNFLIITKNESILLFIDFLLFKTSISSLE